MGLILFCTKKAHYLGKKDVFEMLIMLRILLQGLG